MAKIHVSVRSADTIVRWFITLAQIKTVYASTRLIAYADQSPQFFLFFRKPWFHIHHIHSGTKLKFWKTCSYSAVV